MYFYSLLLFLIDGRRYALDKAFYNNLLNRLLKTDTAFLKESAFLME